MYLIQEKKKPHLKSYRYIFHTIKHIVILYIAQGDGKVIGEMLLS